MPTHNISARLISPFPPKDRSHWVICITCGYHRHHLTRRRVDRVAANHERFHPYHTVQTDYDRLTKPVVKHGYIG